MKSKRRSYSRTPVLAFSLAAVGLFSLVLFAAMAGTPDNTAVGSGALNLTTGTNNTATGYRALHMNTLGTENTADGFGALTSNTGDYNTATGSQSLDNNTTGANNTATGYRALHGNTKGTNNIGLGMNGGVNLTIGDWNIDLGNPGLVGEGKTIRIGDSHQTRAFMAGIWGVSVPSSVPVVIDINGQLSTSAAPAVLDENRNLGTGTAGNSAAEGVFALNPTTTGNHNTATGWEALKTNTTGNDNTANGYQALNLNTTGSNNTATGQQALYSNTIGAKNTATGLHALYSNTTGVENTATGQEALLKSSTGGANTASGFQSLYSNTTGSQNTANGDAVLYSNTTGSNNTASGWVALNKNTTGVYNTATGVGALGSNTGGTDNTAIGYSALAKNLVGNYNTAVGREAMVNTTGNQNVALGFGAGRNVSTGSSNIEVGNEGDPTDATTIRIGTQIVTGNLAKHTRTFVAGISNATVSGQPVYIDTTTGQLGLSNSSERFKDAIESMGNSSEAILSLKPVRFHYKKEIDSKKTPQFGLIAEEVEKVNPDLVVRDESGEIYSVRYDAVNVMLLNEFLKQHRKVEEQENAITQLKATVAQQQKAMDVLTASFKEQAAQIQKVSAEIEVTKPRRKWPPTISKVRSHGQLCGSG